MAEFKFEVKESFGILSTAKNGWNKELTLTSWNGAKPKYDIRSWSEAHEQMGKGITLTGAELKKLKEILTDIKIEE